VSLEKFEKFKDVSLGEYGSLRPDLQFWVKIGDEDKRKEIWKMLVVEFAIPFGRKVEDEYKNSMEKMKVTKTNKYAPLIRFLRSKFDEKSDARTEFRIEFRTFIVSSLGAISNDTIRSFQSMIGRCSRTNANL
jgi:hypothetical protein